MEIAATALDGIADLVGPEWVRYRPDAVTVEPADRQQIANVLRFADERGLSVSPTGSGTKMHWGNPVLDSIHLDLGRLNGLREHAWQDLTCSVDAGCTWATMQSELARHGQMVALDPLWPDDATVGGIVATNDSGSLRYKYGGLRDLIIGMTVVLADGTIAKSGGKVVKNVAGYDLHKLMCGSFGTLGVVVEVNFRLHPLEEQARSWSVQATSASAMDTLLRALMDSQMNLSGLQLRFAGGAYSLDLRMASFAGTLPAQLRQMEKVCGSLTLEPGADEVWLARQRLFARRECIVVKVSTLPGDIASMMEQWSLWAAEHDVEIEIVAQANGLMAVAIVAKEGAVGLVQRMRDSVCSKGGSLVVMQAPNEFRAEIDVWGLQSDAQPLMREIKRRFDPNGVLNPGRFVGGI